MYKSCYFTHKILMHLKFVHFENMKNKINDDKNNLITLPHVNLLFDQMLMNQTIIHTNLSQINKRHGELSKFWL